MPASFRRYWALRFLLGLAVLLGSGAGMPGAAMTMLAGKGSWFLIDLACGLAGFWYAIGAVTPLVRALGEDARLRADLGRDAHRAFAHSSTPRQVFLLLLAVAEADGRAGPAERELVRRFLLLRFVDPIDAADLRTWETEALRTRDLASLARAVARDLDAGERATLYTWSCLVAFADGGFHAAEHDALQRVAKGLGIPADHARLLFHLAQQVHLRSGGRRAPEADGRVPPAPATERDRALATLDLPPDATPELIRKRHRELVRRFHPDAQPNLGPVAQQEATERFRAIQRAYEVLIA